MTVIEIGVMGVKPNHAVMEFTQPEGQILKRAWNSVTAHANGPHWAFGGTEVGDRSMLWGFFEFDSIEHHAEFAKTCDAEVVNDLPGILTHSEFQKRWVVKPDLRPVLQAPVMEIILMYFPSGISESMRTDVFERAQHHIELTFLACTNAKATSMGWTVENDVPLLGRNREDHDVASVLVVYVGWVDLDAAKEFWSVASRRENFEKAMKEDGAFKLVTRYVGCREFVEEGCKYARMSLKDA